MTLKQENKALAELIDAAWEDRGDLSPANAP